jgi:membrane protein
VLRSAAREYEHDYARYFAVAMIYYALLALVPLLLLLMTGLGLLLRFAPKVAEAQQEVLDGMQSSFGGEIASTVQHLVSVLENQSLLPATISLVGMLLTAAALVRHLRMSFRAIWKFPPIFLSGPLVVVILRALAEMALAFAIVTAGGGLLLATLIMLASVRWLTRLVGTEWLLVIPSSLIIAPLIFALLFRFLPPRRMPWRHVWLAAVLCGVAWVAATGLLTLSRNFFGGGFSAYGAIGTLLVAMIWINVVSQCLFFGAELCKVLAAGDTGLSTNTHPSRQAA